MSAEPAIHGLALLIAWRLLCSGRHIRWHQMHNPVMPQRVALPQSRSLAELFRQDERVAGPRHIRPVAIEVGDEAREILAFHGALKRGFVIELKGGLVHRRT